MSCTTLTYLSVTLDVLMQYHSSSLGTLLYHFYRSKKKQNTVQLLIVSIHLLPPPSMKQLILHDYSYFNILSALHSFHLVSCTHNISTLCLSILLATLPVIVPKFIVRRVISRFQSFLFLPPKCPIIPAFWSLEKSTV